MIKIAITGNIASGKSTVEKILSDLQYKTIDTDKIAHDLLDKHRLEIKKTFDGYDIEEDGKISREKLGALVFGDYNLKSALEGILHPKIKDEINLFFEKNKDQKAVFVSVPLLYETGMEKMFDKVLFIYSPDNYRLERLIKRNGYSQEYAKQRMNSQWSQLDKVKKADYVLYNDSDVMELTIQVYKAICQILI